MATGETLDPLTDPGRLAAPEQIAEEAVGAVYSVIDLGAPTDELLCALRDGKGSVALSRLSRPPRRGA